MAGTSVEWVDFGIIWCAFEGGIAATNQSERVQYRILLFLPECFITLQVACEFHIDQLGATGGA